MEYEGPKYEEGYRGTDGAPGFVYAWDSQDKNVGAGEQEIKSIVPDKRVDFDLRFERPMKNTAASSFVLDEMAPQQTKVKWDFRGGMKFPMSLFGFIFKGILGKQLQHGLDNLKKVLEK